DNERHQNCLHMRKACKKNRELSFCFYTMIVRNAMLRKILVLLLFSTSAVLTRSQDAKSNSCESLEAQLKTDAGNVELHQKLIECYFNAEIYSPSRLAVIENAR